MNFILSLEPVKWEDMCRNMGMTAEQIEEKYPRRVILDEAAHGQVIGTIEARNWIEARAKVDESKFYRIQNEGWFPTDTQSAASAQSVTEIDQAE